jgi:hypothetical protein
VPPSSLAARGCRFAVPQPAGACARHLLNQAGSRWMSSWEKAASAQSFWHVTLPLARQPTQPAPPGHAEPARRCP